MDYKDVLFGVLLFSFYTVALVTYTAVLDQFSGEKVTILEQIYNPSAKAFQDYRSSSRNNNNYLLPAYYLIFFLLVVASLFWVMSLRSTFRAWLDSLLGNPSQTGTRPVSPTASATSLTTQASGSSPSRTSVSRNPSKQKVKESHSKSKTPPARKKRKESNVLRASVVDTDLQIIPPLPRLSIKEDTADKLSRVLNKFDSMDMGGSDYDLTPPSKRKND